MHLADDYTPKNDVLRIKVKPKRTKNLTEALEYKIFPLENNKGKIEIKWEYLGVSFDFQNIGT